MKEKIKQKLDEQIEIILTKEILSPEEFLMLSSLYSQCVMEEESQERIRQMNDFHFPLCDIKV